MALRPALVVPLVAALLAAGCTATDGGGAPRPPSDVPTAATRTGGVILRIVTQLGEQCPHIPATPDPSCDPKPRPDTGFQVRSAAGHLVREGRSGPDGRAEVAVPPGEYVVRGDPVPGWLIAPERRVTVSGSDPVTVPLTWTNGIQ
ncbi:hypothetical protein [Micromonospora thermarum]|uniref:Carboxypeptidase regulatory-like domain-containing protein n=1 Tax=Micromonospora thermarum TaxID=2720024 RepID=A0ABX0Z458_9ACTN|nr:hypothetical protein [Micromonospora thermarum]NJP30991.1 hypothetical protein [Micromonospora thermarum]